MLISCPSCKANFAVPARVIGETGKKVKCTKCGHNWFQEPIKLETAKIESLPKAENLGSDKNLPVKAKKKFNFLHIAASVVLAMGLLFTQILKNPSDYPTFAGVVGLEDYSSIRLINFKSRSKIEDNKLNFKLSGQVLNAGASDIKIPEIHVDVMSKGGRVINSMNIKPIQNSLKPYEIISYNPSISKVTGNADKLVISYGNWLENMFSQ